MSAIIFSSAIKGIRVKTDETDVFGCFDVN